jgi:hypothetical protein
MAHLSAPAGSADCFLFGTQAAFIHLGLDATVVAVVWAHLLFVLPYVFLSLADPYRALDPRYAQAAAGLGSTPARAFWRVKLPILIRPVLVALAVGFAVSVDQYPPDPVRRRGPGRDAHDGSRDPFEWRRPARQWPSSRRSRPRCRSSPCAGARRSSSHAPQPGVPAMSAGLELERSRYRWVERA